MEKITDPFMEPKITMDIFVPCPEFHISGRQCEQERGHKNRGLPHVYTAVNEDEIYPVWWDDSGDINIPAFIICPVKECPEVQLVHVIVPDTAMLNMIGHFLDDHKDHDPLTLLDGIWWDE